MTLNFHWLFRHFKASNPQALPLIFNLVSSPNLILQVILLSPNPMLSVTELPTDKLDILNPNHLPYVKTGTYITSNDRKENDWERKKLYNILPGDKKPEKIASTNVWRRLFPTKMGTVTQYQYRNVGERYFSFSCEEGGHPHLEKNKLCGNQRSNYLMCDVPPIFIPNIIIIWLRRNLLFG